MAFKTREGNLFESKMSRHLMLTPGQILMKNERFETLQLSLLLHIIDNEIV